MSKKDELRLLRRQYSIDAPVNAHGRTGESSNVGSMLDLYAHSESAEEILLQRDDEKARKRFEKGFSAYLEHVFTEEERELMRAVLARETCVYTTKDILRAEYIERMEWIQRKAYKNVKPLIALARKTGWSGATEFIKDIYERLKQLSAGADMTDVIPQNQRYIEKRRMLVASSRKWQKNNPEKFRESRRKWNKNNPEKVRESKRKWNKNNPEKVRESKRKWNKNNPEKIQAARRRYNASHREELKRFYLEDRCRKALARLDEALTVWIQMGKPWSGEVFQALERANKRFAYYAAQLKKNGLEKDNGTNRTYARRVAARVVHDI